MKLNVTVQRLARLLRIPEVSGSKLCPETGYSDSENFVGFLGHSRLVSVFTSNQATTASFRILSNLFFTDRNMTCAVKKRR
jgi:hypothetical protein